MIRARSHARPAKTGSRRRLRLRLLMALVVGSVALTGCDFNVYKLPLPGGADLGRNPMTVTADFADVLDLVPKSSVKVNDVNVGEITDISIDNHDNASGGCTGPSVTCPYTATVTMQIRSDTQLPANAIAKIRQTSLLGEKFVSLEAPATGATGRLQSGAVIPLSRTSQNPEVEQVLGALSLVLNGGGIAQLKSIADEINQTLDGREDSTRSVISQLASFTGQLADRKQNIVKAITSLNRLSLSVKAQQGSIDQALDELPSALDSLDRQRGDLVKMIKALNNLSGVGVRVIKRSKESTIEALRQLQPVLTQLANSGNAFVDSISTALTYPFVDEVVGRDPEVARNLQVGDYTNLSVELDVDLTNLPAVPGLPCTTLSQIPDSIPLNQILNLPNLCDSAQAAITKCVNNPSVANCSGLPAGVLSSVCDSLTTPIPVLCDGLLTGLGGGTGNGGKGGNGGGQTGLPGLPGLPSLPGLGGLSGLGDVLNRSGIGAAQNRPAPFRPGSSGKGANGRGPTMDQLDQMFDPALVSLFTPGLVTQ